jgi:hypothetical protein
VDSLERDGRLGRGGRQGRAVLLSLDARYAFSARELFELILVDVMEDSILDESFHRLD